MDNLTHTLTAVAMSQAGLNRKTRFATLALIVGANAPDIDIVSRLGGSATYLEYHRGITHSILGVVVLAAVVAALIYFPGRKARPPRKPSAPPLNGPWLFAVCLIATASHLLMDATNCYGVRPFMPFSGRWMAWDIMFIVDPLLLGLLIAGLGLPAFFRLVSEEVGAKKRGPRGPGRSSLYAASSHSGDCAASRTTACLGCSTPSATRARILYGSAPSHLPPILLPGQAS